MTKNSIDSAIEALQAGKCILVVDDADRENEGDLVLAAEKATTENIAFMVRYTGGVICVPMLPERLDALRLQQMAPENTDRNRTAFTISVDYLRGTSTGISASDRAATIRALADPSVSAEDFSRPGHVFPLRYRSGGVLKRAGHTEASIDLMELAGLQPAAAISEVCNEDGSMMRGSDLLDFAENHDIPMISVAELLRYRRQKEKLVRRVSQAEIPTTHGRFQAYVFQSLLDDIEHLALVRGDIDPENPTLVRVHSECLTGDIFGSRRCDCGKQLDAALKRMADEDCGVLVYLRGHEGRGIGLGHKLRAYSLQDQGRDTVEANEDLGLPVDSREYGIGAQILCDLGVRKMRIMTNNPQKYGGLDGYDLVITERVPLTTVPNEDNYRYLLCKQQKLGHMLELEEPSHA